MNFALLAVITILILSLSAFVTLVAVRLLPKDHKK